MKAKGTYKTEKWEESEFEHISSEMKISKAAVECIMSGEIIGKSVVEYLMYYKYYDTHDQHKSSAIYIGLMRFIGIVQGKEGSFIIEDHGTFENGKASSTLQIIAGSGLGDLKNIQGTGWYSAGQDGAQIELDYTL